MNFNKNRSDRATEIKIDKSEQIKDNKKGFRIIIVSLGLLRFKRKYGYHGTRKGNY